MKQSQMLINEPPLTFQPSLAKALGLDEAIVIQQLHYWLSNPKNEGRIDESGEKWVYNTYAEWQEDNFPFWSEDKIQRVFLSLEKQGVVISAQLDAKKRDMRKFYRINYDVLCAMDDAILRPSNTANLHDVKMNQRIPKNTTDSPSNQKDAVDLFLDYQYHPAQVRKAFADYFRLTPNWEAKYNKQFLEWAVEIKMQPEQVKRAAELWRSDKRFNWMPPSLKGIQEHWLELTDEGKDNDNRRAL